MKTLFFKKALQQCLKAFSHLVYPPRCVACDGGLHDTNKVLCEPCLTLLELIDSKERCPYCFSISYCTNHKVCGDCIKRHPVVNGMAATFEYQGPAAVLIKQLKYANQVHLAEGCGAFLAAQLLQQPWPLPDVIVPVPIAFTHYLGRGFNQSLLLAQALGNIIERPVIDILGGKAAILARQA